MSFLIPKIWPILKCISVEHFVEHNFWNCWGCGVPLHHRQHFLIFSSMVVWWWMGMVALQPLKAVNFPQTTNFFLWFFQRCNSFRRLILVYQLYTICWKKNMLVNKDSRLCFRNKMYVYALSIFLVKFFKNPILGVRKPILWICWVGMTRPIWLPICFM